MMDKGPCVCTEHEADGAPREIGEHIFRLAVDEVAGGGERYRWLCACARSGQWNYQSDSVAYHAWRRHVDNWKLAKGTTDPSVRLRKIAEAAQKTVNAYEAYGFGPAVEHRVRLLRATIEAQS